MFAVASFAPDVDRVRALLDGGADPALKDKRGKTALDLAQDLPESPEKGAILKLLKDASKGK